MKRILLALGFSLLGLIAFDGAVFHSGLYGRVLSPDSTAGYLENVVYGEIQRTKDSPNQVIAVGDSRMAMQARIANESTAETGYTFGSIGVAGASPRAWYYILRAVDPQANRYRGVIVTIETFDDTDTWEDSADRDLDLNYLVGQLGLGDVAEFTTSFDDPGRRWRVARGLIFKGLVYQRDVQDLLSNPLERIKYASEARRYGYNWRYDFVGGDESLAGLTVDWDRREVRIPQGVSEEIASGLHRILVEEIAPQTGAHSEYLKYWLGKIQQHYAGSDTKVIFVRLPRAPLIRPDLPLPNPDSSIHQLASRPNVALVEEHLFDALERPEMFHDEMHLNQPGSEQFTRMLVTEVAAILGPPL